MPTMELSADSKAKVERLRTAHAEMTAALRDVLGLLADLGSGDSPAPVKKRGFKPNYPTWRTPERAPILRSLWAEGIPARDIKATLEADGGNPVPTAAALSQWAAVLGVRRPLNGSSALNKE